MHVVCNEILGVHDMQQASHKAESGDHKHAVNDSDILEHSRVFEQQRLNDLHEHQCMTFMVA